MEMFGSGRSAERELMVVEDYPLSEEDSVSSAEWSNDESVSLFENGRKVE